MYRVTCAALLAAPLLAFAGVQPANAGGIDARGGLKDGSPAPVTDLWTGAYVGVGVGIGKMDGELDVDTFRKDKIFSKKCEHGSNEELEEYAVASYKYNDHHCYEFDWFGKKQTKSFNLDEESDWSFLGTVQLGYDKQISSRHVFGVFADVDWSSADLSFHGSGDSKKHFKIFDGDWHKSDHPGSETSVDGTFEQDWGFTVGGRFGWLVKPRTLLYGLAGYTQVHLDDPTVHVKFDNPYTHHTIAMPDELKGLTLGGGVEKMLGRNFSLKLEYRFSDLSGDSGSSYDDGKQYIHHGDHFKIGHKSESGADADFDAQIHSVRAVLTYRFGKRGPAPAALK